MKKIIIMVAAVISAAIVNAASVSWQANVVEYADETTVDQGTYWLVSMGAANDVSGFKTCQ